MKFVKVDLNLIEQNENSRAVYKEVDLAELMQSMKADGLLQPVGVRDLGRGRYEAVFGNRRIVAARKLGWKDVDAVVVEAETDNDRDFLNLTENLKRQNVTVVEEGRLYSVLIERGLSAKEIASRLNINFIRVETALDAVKHVPKDLAAKVVNRVQGKPMLPGYIPASSYAAIANLRRTEQLNRAQFRSLLEYAQKPEATTAHINAVAPLVKRGFSVGEAVKAASQWERFTVIGFVDKKARDRLETRTGKTINALIWEQLSKNPDLALVQMPTVGGLEIGKYHTKADNRAAEARAARK